MSPAASKEPLDVGSIDKTMPQMLETTGSFDYEEYQRLDALYVGAVKSKLVRKMDLRLLLPLTVYYLFAYIDRSNIGNARLFGLEADLNLTGEDYNNVLMCFFFTYALFDVPSAIILKRIGASLFLSIIMCGFGLVTVLTALSTNKAGIVTCRVFLGVFESGLFPGVIYILSFWYSRYELQTRISIFFAGASASGAFAGLLAYAIAELDGHLGYRAWRWIYGIEGIATIVLGASAWFLISDTPLKSGWLSDEEKQYLTLRQKFSSGAVPQSATFQWRYVKQALTDWKPYCSVILFLANSIPVYGLSFTMPTIMRSLGYSAARAQGVTAPPYIFAAIVTVIVSMLSDRTKQRGYFIAGPYLVAACGFGVLMGTAGKVHLTGVTFFGVFLTAGGMYSALPPIMGWLSNNVEGETKRGVCIAIVPTLGQLGGVIGSHIYLSSQRPKYPLGFGLSLGVVVVMGIGGSLGMRYALAKVNQRRDAMQEESVRNEFTEAELTEMGDKSPLFRYVL